MVCQTTYVLTVDPLMPRVLTWDPTDEFWFREFQGVRGASKARGFYIGYVFFTVIQFNRY